VGSPLSLRQLQKYKRKGCKYLIAITKHYPEVLPEDIRTIEAFALRWQDVHRSIAESTTRSPAERFLRREFLAYLEDLDMAHRENITKRDLVKLSKTFSALRGGHAKLSDSFRTAEAAADLLEAVRLRLLENYSALRKWSKSGPFCGYNTDEGDNCAYIGWHLRHHKSSRRFSLGIGFPATSAGLPFVDVLVDSGEPPAKLSMKNMIEDHYVSEDKVFNFAESHAKKWGVVK